MSITQQVATQKTGIRRALAISLLVAVACLLWVVLVWPVFHVFESQYEWRHNAIHALARDRGLLDTESSVRDQLKSLSTSALTGKLYSQNTDGAAANAIQADVAILLNGGNVTSQSMSPIAPSRENALRRIGLRISATMTIEQLKNLMTRIAAHTRYLRIGMLEVNAPQLQDREQNPALTISMELYGYRAAVETVKSEARASKSAADSHEEGV